MNLLILIKYTWNAPICLIYIKYNKNNDSWILKRISLRILSALKLLRQYK